MAVEQINEQYWEFSPGPIDVHAHPRVFDGLTLDNFVPLNEGSDGKAGLRVYTEVALRSGITAILAMPNESIRRYDPKHAEQSSTVPYPIATRDRVLAMQARISTEAVVPTGVYMGLDPETLFSDVQQRRINTNLLQAEFTNVRNECLGLKIYLAETTGGNNIAIEHSPEVVRIWNHHNPEKPIIFHVEGSDVAPLLADIAAMKGGKGIPLHIAHVSSRQELQAVINAKKAGMNVTCEVTPHHLFLNDWIGEILGGYGCMKPGLKSAGDVSFLWSNLRFIDMFASDCAPHRRSDKEADNPAYGVTNHAVMLPLLLAAVEDGRLTMEELNQKLCATPRERFNLPLDDGSMIGVSTAMERKPNWYEKATGYGYNPFVKLPEPPRMIGEIVVARAGVSEYTPAHEFKHVRPSLMHLITPANAKPVPVPKMVQREDRW